MLLVGTAALTGQNAGQTDQQLLLTVATHNDYEMGTKLFIRMTVAGALGRSTCIPAYRVGGATCILTR